MISESLKIRANFARIFVLNYFRSGENFLQLATSNLLRWLNDIIRNRRSDSVGKRESYGVALPAGNVKLCVVRVGALEENLIICVCRNGCVMILSDRPEDDGGLHINVSRLSIRVCAARAAAVVSNLHNVALKILAVELIADCKCVSGRVTRDDCCGRLARSISGGGSEDDGAGVECVCNLWEIAFNGVEDLKGGVAEPPDLTDVRYNIINADLLCNAYGLVVVLVQAVSEARCGALCGLESRLGPEVDHNALKIELGELLVFVHQSTEVVGMRMRDDPSSNGDVLVGLCIIL